MSGGIHAWEGLVADGPADAGLSQFEAAGNPAEMAAISWTMEENTRKFYLALSGLVPDSRSSDLFQSLAEAEESHKATLVDLFRDLSGKQDMPDLAQGGPPLLEGGMDLDGTLHWVEGKPLEEVLDIVLALETNAYDRYIKMLNIVEDEPSRSVFRSLSDEERKHLDRLTALMDETLQSDYDYRE